MIAVIRHLIVALALSGVTGFALAQDTSETAEIEATTDSQATSDTGPGSVPDTTWFADSGAESGPNNGVVDGPEERPVVSEVASETAQAADTAGEQSADAAQEVAHAALPRPSRASAWSISRWTGAI